MTERRESPAETGASVAVTARLVRAAVSAGLVGAAAIADHVPGASVAPVRAAIVDRARVAIADPVRRVAVPRALPGIRRGLPAGKGLAVGLAVPISGPNR